VITLIPPTAENERKDGTGAPACVAVIPCAGLSGANYTGSERPTHRRSC
jgi:hypothetical protein